MGKRCPFSTFFKSDNAKFSDEEKECVFLVFPMGFLYFADEVSVEENR